MSTSSYDWAELMSADMAQAMAAGAEHALADATSQGRALDEMSRTDHALVGIGFAILAVRAQLAQTGQDAADQLASIADDTRDLTDAVTLTRPVPGRWRRLVDPLTRRFRRSTPIPPDVGDATGDEGQGEAVQEDLAVPGPPGQRLSVVPGGTGARS